MKMYLCDFGFGVRRVDVTEKGREISIVDHIDDQTGEWSGYGFAVPFDFRAESLNFLHRLSRFNFNKKRKVGGGVA